MDQHEYQHFSTEEPNSFFGKPSPRTGGVIHVVNACGQELSFRILVATTHTSLLGPVGPPAAMQGRSASTVRVTLKLPSLLVSPAIERL